ncbi:hypothetical protein [Streptomyces sp. SID5770]|uniref:hypothetical protein n=1 Tax=Streptomyces sp. SID5770 TaxID=2690308 RepID=UPI0031BB40D1
MSSQYFRAWPLSTAAKTIVTFAALAAAYARILGRKAELASSTDPQDAEDTGKHPINLGKAGRQLTWAQWAVPALTGCCLAAGPVRFAEREMAAGGPRTGEEESGSRPGCR